MLDIFFIDPLEHAELEWNLAIDYSVKQFGSKSDLILCRASDLRPNCLQR